MMRMSIEDQIGIRDPLKEGGIQVKVEGHLIEEDIQIEDLPGEDISIEMEGLLEEEENILEENPPMVEGSLVEIEDPLMVEDPLEMKDPLDSPVDEDHQALKDLLGQ